MHLGIKSSNHVKSKKVNKRFRGSWKGKDASIPWHKLISIRQFKQLVPLHLENKARITPT